MSEKGLGALGKGSGAFRKEDAMVGLLTPFRASMGLKGAEGRRLVCGKDIVHLQERLNNINLLRPVMADAGQI